MKVTVRRTQEGKYDVRVKRTRRSEGNSTGAKGLTKAELETWLGTEIPKVDHPLLPLEPG